MSFGLFICTGVPLIWTLNAFAPLVTNWTGLVDGTVAGACTRKSIRFPPARMGPLGAPLGFGYAPLRNGWEAKLAWLNCTPSFAVCQTKNPAVLHGGTGCVDESWRQNMSGKRTPGPAAAVCPLKTEPGVALTMRHSCTSPGRMVMVGLERPLSSSRPGPREAKLTPPRSRFWFGLIIWKTMTFSESFVQALPYAVLKVSAEGPSRMNAPASPWRECRAVEPCLCA